MLLESLDTSWAGNSPLFILAIISDYQPILDLHLRLSPVKRDSLRAGETAQLVKCLLPNYKDPSQNPSALGEAGPVHVSVISAPGRQREEDFKLKLNSEVWFGFMRHV